MKLRSSAISFGALLALVFSQTHVARAQALLASPDLQGKFDLLAHSCQPKNVQAGRTIGGVFIPAAPGTWARFDCHVPTFGEQSYTVAIDGLYDIVVAGANGGRGAFIRTPNVADNSPSNTGGIFSMPGRADGGAGGVVHGQMLLRRGTVLYIDVGQRGGDGGAVSGGGGGGATFLLNADKSPIAVGAGGGGASWTEDPGEAPKETMTSAQKLGPGQGGGGTEDNDAMDSGGGGGGAGFYQDGANGFGRLFGLGHSYGGFDYAEGLYGGYGGSGVTQVDFAGMGGFGGGGGGGDGTRAGGGGGGGGYQGGMGGLGRAQGLIGIAAGAYGGTGGTNFSGSLLNVNTTGSNADDGYVTLIRLQ